MRGFFSEAEKKSQAIPPLCLLPRTKQNGASQGSHSA